MPDPTSTPAAPLSPKQKYDQLIKIREFKEKMMEDRVDAKGNPVVGVLNGIDAAHNQIIANRTGSVAGNEAHYRGFFNQLNHLDNGMLGVVAGMDPAAKADVERANTANEAANYPNRQIYVGYEGLISQEDLMQNMSGADRLRIVAGRASVMEVIGSDPVMKVASAIDAKEAALEAELKALDPDKIVNWNDKERVENGIRNEQDWNKLVSDRDNAPDAASRKAAEDALQVALDKENAALQDMAVAIRDFQMNPAASPEPLAKRVALLEEKAQGLSLAEDLIRNQRLQAGHGVASPYDYNRLMGIMQVHMSVNRDRKNPGVTAMGIPKFFRSLDAAGMFVGAYFSTLAETFGESREQVLERGLNIDHVKVRHNPYAVLDFLADSQAVAEAMGAKIKIDWEAIIESADEPAKSIIRREHDVNWGKHMDNARQRVRDKTDVKEGEDLKDAVGRKYMGHNWYAESKEIRHDLKAGDQGAAAPDLVLGATPPGNAKKVDTDTDTVKKTSSGLKLGGGSRD